MYGEKETVGGKIADWLSDHVFPWLVVLSFGVIVLMFVVLAISLWCL